MPNLFACVVVYVRIDMGGLENEKKRIDFHRSLGGQGHLACESAIIIHCYLQGEKLKIKNIACKQTV